ncbi:hypothetical protein MTO96_033984 [Rhipicephalus appendiculatus]
MPLSPVLSGQGKKQPQCLEFWYLSVGMKSARLQVDVMVNGKSEVLWEQPNFVEKGWMLARVEILQEKEFKVVYRAKFPERDVNSISLDDVVLRPEPCRHPAHCEFLDGLCGYVSKFGEGIRWRVGKGRYEGLSNPPAVPLEEDITGANLSVFCYGNASDPANAEAQSVVQLLEVSQWSVMDVRLKRGTRCQLSLWVSAKGNIGAMAIASVKALRIVTVIQFLKKFDSPGEYRMLKYNFPPKQQLCYRL